MAEGTIRINKVLKDFNIGLSTLTDFLKKKGIQDELTLTSKISEDVFAMVAKEFGKEQLIKEQSRKVAIKVKEITEMENSRTAVEEEEPVKEVIIKTNVFTEQKKVETPAPEAAPKPVVEKPAKTEPEEKVPSQPKGDLKIVGHIDLTPKKKAQPEAPKKEVPEKKVEEPKAAEPAPVVKPQPAAPKPKEEKPEKHEERPVVEHIETRVEKLAGPKTVGVIDLSQFEKKPSTSEHGKKDKNKRERIHKGAAKVDISNPKNSVPARPGAKDNAAKDSARSKGAKKGERFKAVRPEFDSDEIQKQIKETYARMTEGHGKTKTSKHRREKREEISQKMQEEQERQERKSRSARNSPATCSRLRNS